MGRRDATLFGGRENQRRRLCAHNLCVGEGPHAEIHRGGYVREEAVIEENTLKLKLRNGAFVEYRLAGDKLQGKYLRGSRRHSIILKRSGK